MAHLSKAIQRINRDLKELSKNPIAGISVVPFNNDMFTLHGSVTIQTGIYKDIPLHLVIHLPSDYPITGPAINLAPGVKFDHGFHEHIHNDEKHGHSLCNDMLTNFSAWFASQDGSRRQLATGWSPGYTLTTILAQLATFFAEPDLPAHLLPSKDKIDAFKKKNLEFKCICGYETKSEVSPTEEKKEEKTDIKTQLLKESVTCGITKMNLLDDKTLILGYPLYVEIDKYSRLWPTPVLELISYDAYLGETTKTEHSDLFSMNNYFISVTGQKYNCWIPCYFNAEHFERALPILNKLFLFLTHNDEPEAVLDVLPNLMNKTIVMIMNGQMHESRQAIEAYCHFLRLFIAYRDKYATIKKNINNVVESFLKSVENRHKSKIPDIGEFIIKIFVSDYKYTQIQQTLIAEYFARQIYWMKRKNVQLNMSDITLKLKKAFEQSQISWKLLIFNLEMAKTFIDKADFKQLDINFGYPPTDKILSFQETIKHIKKNIIDFTSVMQAIGYDKIINNQDRMHKFLMQAVEMSDHQGYT